MFVTLVFIAYHYSEGFQRTVRQGRLFEASESDMICLHKSRASRLHYLVWPRSMARRIQLRLELLASANESKIYFGIMKPFLSDLLRHHGRALLFIYSHLPSSLSVHLSGPVCTSFWIFKLKNALNAKKEFSVCSLAVVE